MTMDNLDKKDLSNRLESFGLSFDEARVYVLLSMMGEQDATNIARMMGMVRSSVYPVMHLLDERGLVDITGGAVKKYLSRPLNPFLDAEIKKTQDKLGYLSRQRAYLSEAFSMVTAPLPKGETEIIEQPEILAQIIRNMVENTESEFVIMVGGESSAQVGESYNLAENTPQSRGLDLRVLTCVKAGNIQLVKGYWPSEYVRHTDLEPTASILVRDGVETVIIKPVPEFIDFAYIQNYGTHTNDPALAKTLNGLILEEWERSVPLEEWERENT